MNDPVTMLTNLMPAKYSGWIIFLLAISPYITRGLHAWLNHGDIRSVIAAIFFGTNTPMPNSQADDPKQAKLPLSAVLLFVVPCSLMFMAGCAGGPQATAYKAAGTTIISVDAAMGEWGAYVKAWHPPATQEQAVKDAYAKYQAAMAVVCDAGAIYASTSQTNSPAAQAALQTAVANATTEIADLESLIAKFGVQLK